MRGPLLLATPSLVAVTVGVLIATRTSAEHTLLLGDDFGGDTAIAVCATIAVAGFLAANIALLAHRGSGDGGLITLAASLWTVFLAVGGGIVVLICWLGVGSYSTLSTGTVVRTVQGFPERQVSYYQRDGIWLSLLGRDQ